MEPEAKRVRPSSLGMAQHCKRAPWLSSNFHESHVATRLGSAVDRQLTSLILGAALDDDILPETEVLFAWLSETFPPNEWEYHAQLPVVLLDPKDQSELTRGTPDLICRHRTEPRLSIVDYKKRGQLWAGHLPPPDENPQLRAYLAAAWLTLATDERPIKWGEIVLACWDENGVLALKNMEPLSAQTLWAIVEEIRAVPPVDSDGPMPEASVGDHCTHCWQRMHCDAHLMPAVVASQIGLVEPEATGVSAGAITSDNVVAALTWLDRSGEVLATAKKLREFVQDNVDNYVDRFGPVVVGELAYQAVVTKGKRQGPTVTECEARGLFDLIRPGKPGVRHTWKPIPKDQT